MNAAMSVASVGLGAAKSAIRSGPFDRYFQWQASIMMRVLSIGLGLWLASFVVFALLRLFTGISIKRLGYCSLRHIAFSPQKGVDVQIRKLGFSLHRPTIASPGWVTFEIAECDITVDPRVVKVQRHKHGGEHKRSDSNTCDTPDTMFNLPIDPDLGILLVPMRKKKLRRVVKWLLSRARVFDVLLYSASITYKSMVAFVVTFASLRIDVRNLQTYHKRHSYVGTLDSYELAEDEMNVFSKLMVSDVYAAQQLDDENPVQLVNHFTLDMSAVMHREMLRMKELKILFSVGRLAVDWSKLVRVREQIYDLRKVYRYGAAERGGETKESVKLARACTVLVHLVKQFEVKIGAIETLNIPLAPPEVNAFCLMSDFNLELRLMNSNSPGFKLLFEPGDLGHQTIFTVASVNLGLDRGKVQEEILYIPLISGLIRGNLISKTLEYIRDDNAIANESFAKGHVYVNSPAVSVHQHQLPLFLRTHLRSTSFSSSGRSSGSIPIKVPFQKLLPKLDIQFGIGDPALRLVVASDNVEKSTMFTGQAKRININVESRHKVKSTATHGVVSAYKLSSKLQLTEGNLAYVSHNVSRFILSTFDQIDCRMCLFTYPMLSTCFDITILHSNVSLIKSEIFHVVRKLIRECRSVDTQSSANSPDPGEPLDLLMSIPMFVASIRINIERYVFDIASDRFRNQTSELLGLRTAMQHCELHYERSGYSREYPEMMDQLELSTPRVETGFPGAFDERFVRRQIRKLSIHAHEFNLYKVDNTFLGHAQDDEHLLKQARFLHLPSLDVFATSRLQEKGRITDISANVPELRLDFNIELLLAAMVIREVLNHARGRMHNKGMAMGDDGNHSRSRPSRKLAPWTLGIGSENMRIKLSLPNEEDLMLELTSSHFTRTLGEEPKLTANAFRLYSRYPFYREAWCIIISLSDLGMSLNFVDPADDMIKLDLTTVCFNVPYDFKVYRIIDNGITMFKAVKTLIKQTELADPLLVIQQHAIEGIPNIPRIRLTTKSLLFAMEDDIFEAKLNLIFKTGLIELESRSQKQVAFGRMVKDVLQQVIELEEQLDKEPQDSSHPNSRATSESVNDATSSFEKASNNMNERKRRSADDSTIGKSPRGESKSPEPSSSTYRRSLDSRRPDFSRSKSRNIIGSKDGHRLFGALSRSNSDKTHFGLMRQHHEETFGKIQQKEARAAKLQTMRELVRVPFDLGLLDNHDLGDRNTWLYFWHSAEFADIRQMKIKSFSQEEVAEGAVEISLETAREHLLQNFSDSWIYHYCNARDVQETAIHTKRRELYPDNLDTKTCSDEIIVNYSKYPLLLSILMQDVTLYLQRTTCETREGVHRFMYDVGKGLPADTEFSIFIPLFVDFQVHHSMRIDLRDYPLPILHFPPLAPNQDKRLLAMRARGNLIVTEQLVHIEQVVRKLYVPLSKKSTEGCTGPSVDVLQVRRNLVPIKTYTVLQIDCLSSLPSRLCWCSAYKPALHLMQQGFGNFTKPPIDLSPALGFWDKIRLVFHARVNFNLPYSPLYLLLKADRDPYTLAGRAAGISFVWKDNVEVRVNPDNDPANLIVVLAEKHQTLIPDYVVWEADFLSRRPAERAFSFKTDYKAMAQSRKILFNFTGKVSWRIGMHFKRQLPDDIDRTDQFKHHWMVNLNMPEFVRDIDSYDAYHGFRSDYIFMALEICSFNPKNEAHVASNSAHFTLAGHEHFLYWKSQFKSALWPPVRTGKLFPGESVKKANFSTALSSVQYQIALEPLSISFFNRLKSVGIKSELSTGLKARMTEFRFYLHTRREPTENCKRWTMQRFLGEVDMKTIDIRVINVNFKTSKTSRAVRTWKSDWASDSSSVTSESQTQPFSPSYAESRSRGSQLPPLNYAPPQDEGITPWIDPNDLTDVNSNVWSSHDTIIGSEVLPFLYTPQISYFRQTDKSGRKTLRWQNRTYLKFGSEVVHDPLIEKHHPETKQKELILIRIKELQERIKDLKTSIESLGVDDPDPNVVARIKDLRALVRLGEQSIEWLCSEASQCDSSVETEKHRAAALQKWAEHEDKIAAAEAKREFALKMHVSQDDSASVSDESCFSSTPPPDVHVRRMSMSSCLNVESSGEIADLNSIGGFRNRFMLHAVHVKWNNDIRNIIYKLAASLKHDHEIGYARARRAVRYLEKLVQGAEEKAESNNMHEESGEMFVSTRAPSTKEYTKETKSEQKRHGPLKSFKKSKSPQSFEMPGEDFDGNTSMPKKMARERLSNFSEEMSEVGPDESPVNSFLIRLLTPRIQLISEKNPNKCVMVAARDVDLRIVTVYDSQLAEADEASVVEKRYGVIFDKAGFFMIGEEDTRVSSISTLCLEPYTMSSRKEDNSYWPPWLALEMCYGATSLERFQIVKNTDLTIRYDMPNHGHVDQHNEVQLRDQLYKIATYDHSAGFEHHLRVARLIVDIPYLKVACDTVQFYTAYMIAADLMAYVDPLTTERKKAIECVLWSTDFTASRMQSLEHIRSIQNTINSVAQLKQQIEISTKGKELTKRQEMQILALDKDIFSMDMELIVLIRAFKSGMRKELENDSLKISKWSVLVDEIIVHVLDERGTPFMSLAANSTHFSRIINDDIYVVNRAALARVDAWNLMPKAVYPNMLSSYGEVDREKAVICCQWKVLNPVGGIPTIEYCDVRFQPLRVQLERNITDRLMEFVFAIKKGQNKDEDNENESEFDTGLDSDSDNYSDENSDESTEADEASDNKDLPSAALKSTTRWADPMTRRVKRMTTLVRRIGLDPSENAHDINQMVERASSYMNVVLFLMRPSELAISYKGRSNRNLLDLQNVVIPLPALQYRNKIWTKLDLAMRLKRDIIRVLLSHTGALLTNKFVRHQKQVANTTPVEHYDPSGRLGSPELEEIRRVMTPVLFPLHQTAATAENGKSRRSESCGRRSESRDRQHGNDRHRVYDRTSSDRNRRCEDGRGKPRVLEHPFSSQSRPSDDQERRTGLGSRFSMGHSNSKSRNKEEGHSSSKKGTGAGQSAPESNHGSRTKRDVKGSLLAKVDEPSDDLPKQAIDVPRTDELRATLVSRNVPVSSDERRGRRHITAAAQALEHSPDRRRSVLSEHSGHKAQDGASHKRRSLGNRLRHSFTSLGSKTDEDADDGTLKRKRSLLSRIKRAF